MNGADEDVLIFQWRGRPRRVWRLAAVLGFSLLGHAATFYLFQVAYTPTGSLQPPAAQVVIIAPEEPAGRLAFEQWLKMADPALMTSPPSTAATADTLAKIGLRYVPSYTGVPPAFKSLEPVAGRDDYPMPERTRPPGPVPFAHPGEATVERGGMTSTAALPTRLVFRGPIEPLAPAVLPAWKFAATKGTRPLEPTVYLVGVHVGGGAPSLFRQPGMPEGAAGDDAALEEAALEYLAKLPFQSLPGSSADGGAITWGWATFYWGREVYQ